MITAEKYMMDNMQGADFQEIESALIGFATLKCQELLMLVAEKADKAHVGGWDLDRDEVLNAVDLDKFIKLT